MAIQSLRELTALLLLCRQATRRRLYKGGSLIPVDLLLLVMANFSDGREPVSVKTILSKLPYSATAIRYHLYVSKKRGLLSLSRDTQDQRMVRVQPTQKLIDQLSEMRADLSPHLAFEAHSLRD